MVRFATIGVLLVVLITAGCASGTKSGGTVGSPIRIVMQSSDGGISDDPNLGYFVSQVRQRSGGQIQIVVGNRYSNRDVRNEARLVRALRSGEVQMGYIASRAWEEASPVTAFRALQAPLLVTNYRLLHRITTGRIGHSMLSSLSSIGLVGLGLVPQRLRRLFGSKPLDSAGTLRGAHIRPVTSPTGEKALRWLGAVPVLITNAVAAGPALKQGRIDGVESETISIENNGYMNDAHDLTANIALFAKATTIVIRRSVFDRLSTSDRGILRAAAQATVAHADPAAAERADVPELCRQKVKLVTATPADLASLQPLARHAYAALERDATTRREIQAIEKLKETMPAASSDIPACPSSGKSQQTRSSGSSVVNGTYVVNLTRGEVDQPSKGQTNENWGSFQLSLRDGRFRISDQRPAGNLVQGALGGFSAGTYAIDGRRITFTIDSAAGDTPMGKHGDPSLIYTWSKYRGGLTFRHLPPAARARANARGLDAGGPPLLYVKPWRLGSASKSSAPGPSAKLVGTWEMNISKAEMESKGVLNYGLTRLVLGRKSFRISDSRPSGERPLVQGSSHGWTSGTYSVRGNRLTFVIGNGRGDTPLGAHGDTPIVVLWSVYRNNTLTFQRGKKNEGGAGLWLKPWTRVK